MSNQFLFYALVLTGTSNFWLYALGLAETSEKIGRLFVSPRPYPFVGLPENLKMNSPYDLEICFKGKCKTTNYLDLIKKLKGPHRYRAPFYLLPLENLEQNPRARLAMGRVLCENNLFSDRTPETARMGGQIYFCEQKF